MLTYWAGGKELGSQLAPSKLGTVGTIVTHVSMFLRYLCVHLCAFPFVTHAVKSVEITIPKTSDVSMHFVCAFDSLIKLKTAAKVNFFQSVGNSI